MGLKYPGLRWLEDAPSIPCGVTWGVPWQIGELNRSKTDAFALISPSGNPVELQTWPTAYWPDGSVKWTAHAASLEKPETGDYSLQAEGKSVTNSHTSPLSVKESVDEVTVDTGAIRCVVGKQGKALIRGLYHGEKRIGMEGSLVCIGEERRTTPSGKLYQEESFYGEITSVTIEQEGPTRVVLSVEGVHISQDGERSWLPFKLRLYFYVNQASIRIVHTIVFNGNPQEDFVKGIGISFGLPLKEPLYNRYVRFAGDNGFFSESPRHLSTRRTNGVYTDMFRRQQAGESITFDPEKDAPFTSLLEDSAAWDGYKLTQLSADSYSVVKQTNEQCSWVKAVSGNRANGLVYAGDTNGGLAAGLRNFWQKHPSSLEVTGLTTEEAKLTLWFWSPDSAAMDMRHYDTTTHVDSAYEGSQELRSTPYGIGNTNELMLWCCDRTPTLADLAAMTKQVQAPPQFVCEPEQYHNTNVFGIWSLPDRSTPAKAWVEEQLDALVSFYKQEVEQRRWYGFWDYGDFMHTYDPARHNWRYDVGGFAWQNTELVPNMWLWLSFLRSGRGDLFRMAEAMTRHTSEVDVYHLGEYAGLGSRHNVVHWGCGCKEARIAMAGLHRYYYFLTADERTGDILTEVADADYATVQTDPMRDYFPKDDHPTHARSGPDWAAFSSNWMSQWERFESDFYRDKILQGIKDLKAAPFRLLSGTTFGYDPKTGILSHISDANYDYHMVIAFGAPQVWMELSQLITDPEWDDMLAEFGEFYYLKPEEKLAWTNGAIHPSKFSWPMMAAGMAAFAANRLHNAELAADIWRIMLENRLPGGSEDSTFTIQVPELEYVRPIQELPHITTNIASQWSLNAILCLELIGQELPAELHVCDQIITKEK
ncbi:hypothetical protein M5X11_24855 [Paenibacillus alginolyticus]|uniref:Tat pathway signal sequence domain protein n=1 Tax=Paenibacillus alginolyticus TaxID=59839 RepID=A0ABT4GMM9_9BACL|nr:hypothetical protein [Paenibacillus alginolyticus]MCY9668114.1 hypothetical protein [Paenibacillus alginolyticus]MCY9697472.1 hypothetical protein [Paenibacillus alginolyticus]MEC0148293.1 hypothetical protein [Paenibacillus alginolyticus]